MDGIEETKGPRAEDVAKLENEVKALRREVSEMKELIRSLLQVLMENSEDDEEDMYGYT
ncbi:hypothetical protein [Candidatus Aciduliprofundum boonei]|uniref:Uncharacterized protein n=1 Tax=Aciduliprofundum boonei (strain DSM 19572 / T469) TaxID=439481 RepID=B5I9R0_ACIB4|nr:hypothetical protein [Candidatus Aciduliprofundum boonei]ADD08463.1 hypothetical protein Aboo_0652 [Aciduliprofundum boonei T469]EDY36828.1 hypothetical protein ABOONEI_1749 [Aciduliprofundum boonei T469]HII55332.1 hypothetical protein [Candidatus Aciduliprofundum boonei]